MNLLTRRAILASMLSSGVVLARGDVRAAPSLSLRARTWRRTADGATIIEGSPPALRATPRGDQTLRLAGPTDGPYSLDPALSRDLSSAFFIRQIFRGLMGFDQDLNPFPDLAERIEISADGLEYRFLLRDDAAFQDGSPIRSAAVVVSLDRAVRPSTADGDVNALGGPTFLSDIVGVDRVIAGDPNPVQGIVGVDDRTVLITLQRPRSTFLMKLASAAASIVNPSDAARGADGWRTPNGSGAFRVDEWQPDDHMVLRGVDTFYSGAPALRRVEIRLGPSAGQSFNLYQADEIDHDAIDVTAIDRVRAPESGYAPNLTETPLFALSYIAMRSDVEPLDDVHIRRAIQLAFPREKIARVTLDGRVEVASGVVPSGMLGENWPSELLNVDVDAAKAEIVASRYGTADRVPPIRVYVSGAGGAASLRDSVAQSVGLRVDVIDVEWPAFVSGLSARSYPAYELYWGADYPDPESILETLFGSGRADNYVDYANDSFDELLAQAARAGDAASRIDLYRRAQQTLIDDLVVIPMYFDRSYSLTRSTVHGLDVTPMGMLRLDGVWMER